MAHCSPWLRVGILFRKKVCLIPAALMVLFLLILFCGISMGSGPDSPTYDPEKRVLDIPCVDVRGEQLSWLLQESARKKGQFTIISEAKSKVKSETKPAVFYPSVNTLIIPGLVMGNKVLDWTLSRNPDGSFKFESEVLVNILSAEAVVESHHGDASFKAVGEVVYVVGQAYSEEGSISLPLQTGSPIYKNNIIVTRELSRIEIHFSDNTILAMGENSRIVINEYVFSPENEDDSTLLMLMSHGRYRVLAGSIAKINPEKFTLKSSLAEIRIKGTEVMVVSDPEGDQLYVLEISQGRSLEVSDKAGNKRVIQAARTAVDLAPDKEIGFVRRVTPGEWDRLEKMLPIVFRPIQGKGRPGRSSVIDQIVDRQFMMRIDESMESSAEQWFVFPKPREIKTQDARILDRSDPQRYKFNADSYQPLECDKCHKADYAKIMEKKYVHLPVLKKDCPVCHVSLKNRQAMKIEMLHFYKFVAQKESYDGKNDKPLTEREKKTVMATLEREEDERIYVHAQTDDARDYYQKIFLPPMKTLPELDADKGPLKIHDVRVSEIKHDLFTTATITWKTNRLSRAIINSGIDQLDNSPIIDRSWGYEHEITLSELRQDTRYQFSIIANDLQGKKAESGIHRFSTKEDILETREQKIKGSMDLANEFFCYEDNYIVRFTANQPMFLQLARLPDAFAAKEWLLPEDHPIMTSRRMMNIDICYNCHEYRRGHVVNVPPRRGMKFPAEYPVLPDGRMTCQSCHIGHSADINQRVRNEDLSLLCIGCHTEKGFVVRYDVKE
ncbi:MAG: FecR domain-containing protein [Proteobacteria bacterium]|nr:FecR domain-containing protein [Pseudomonadota bacterium]